MRTFVSSMVIAAFLLVLITAVGAQSNKFGNPKKTPHYESNVPEHGSTLPAAPINVVLNFNFDLHKKSSISIKTGNKEYGTGETTVDSSKLAMRRAVNPSAPNGKYTVTYSACWPDGSCHQGNFAFAINKTGAKKFQDMRNKKEVTVRLSQVKFQPAEIRISKGTKVTWVNDDNFEHSINSDPHPGHNYLSSQNSPLLKKGGTYTMTFPAPGFYPYHCSPHASFMKAAFIVE